MLPRLVVGLLVLAHPTPGLTEDRPRIERGVPRGVAEVVVDSLPGVDATCTDFRGGEPFVVQGQHVLGNGAIDSGWSPGGALCVGSTVDVAAVVVRDGSGGAVVVWADPRMGHADVYALRLTASGDVAAGWPSDGVAVCTRPGDQDQVAATSDGAGGVFIAWQDYRSGANANLYAQHVTATGETTWEPEGVAMAVDTLDQSHPAICGDAQGGALVVWQQGVGSGADLKAAVVSSGGAVTVVPGSLVGGPGVQRNPRLARDLENGAYLMWEDTRDGNSDVRVLRLWLDGTSWIGEPGGHLSLSVGDPGGIHRSYSFGTRGQPASLAALFTARAYVYEDLLGMGRIEPGTYRRTSPEEDHALLKYLEAAEGAEGYWLRDGTCRGWVTRQYDALVRQGIGTPALAPHRSLLLGSPSSDPPLGSGTTLPGPRNPRSGP
jgi:hypothetical protein